MTIELFYLIIAVQLLLFLRELLAKDYVLAIFAFLSAGLTVMIAALVEYNLHHQLRSLYGIPNTAVYLSGFIIIAIFAWSFKKVIMKFDYSLLLMGGALWTLSVFIDLLTDGRVVTIIYNDIIEAVFFIAGTVFLLMFYVSIYIRMRSLKKVRRVV